MKRLLFLLLLIPVLSFGQEVTTYSGKALTYGGDVATYAYCDEYQAVYDAYTVKPSDAVAAVWNTFVANCVATGEWAVLDALWNYAGVSDNTNGEALLDWKQPAGGPSLMDAGKGTFDSGTESWVVFGNNTIANDAGALKITYVDNVSGAYCIFSAASDLTTNLTVGKSYRVRVKAKVNGGSSVNLLIWHGATTTIGTVTATDFTWYEGVFVATNATTNNLQMNLMGAGEIIWIDEWTIQEWTNATAYNAPTFTALEGFTGNGTTQYIDCNWNPSVNGVNYVQNSASFGYYARTIVDGSQGVADLTKYVVITLNTGNSKINDATWSDPVTGTMDAGLQILNRSAAATKDIFINKTKYSGSVTSTGVPDNDLYTLGYNNNGTPLLITVQLSMAFAGGGLTPTQVTNLTNYYNAAMTALGKNVF